jgi:hypothetical protein
MMHADSSREEGIRFVSQIAVDRDAFAIKIFRTQKTLASVFCNRSVNIWIGKATASALDPTDRDHRGDDGVDE